MTIYELAERDLRKAKINLEQAQQRPNVPLLDLQHLKELCVLRERIVEILQSQKQSEGEWKPQMQELGYCDTELKKKYTEEEQKNARD